MWHNESTCLTSLQYRIAGSNTRDRARACGLQYVLFKHVIMFSATTGESHFHSKCSGIERAQFEIQNAHWNLRRCFTLIDC